MPLPPVTVTATRNPDGTVTFSWAADADPNIDEYSVSIDGAQPIIVRGLSTAALPGNVPHTVNVTASSADAISATGSYTPPPSLKAALRGLGDRQGVPKIALAQWFVVDAPMSALWDGIHGHPLTPNNPLDQALALGNYQIKLRASRAGGAPAAMKSIGGFSPVNVTDTASGASATVGPFWRADYLDAYSEYQRLLAAKYDSHPLLREVVMSEPALVYDEPFRQYGGLGYTPAEYAACFSAMYAAHKVWPTTRQEVAFNPANVGGIAFTLAQIAAVPAAFGNQGMVGNNSLRATSMGSAYDQMYAAILALKGKVSIYFQTATMARMGDPATTFKLASDLGASSVELPSGYQSIPLPVLQAAQFALLSNPAP